MWTWPHPPGAGCSSLISGGAEVEGQAYPGGVGEVPDELAQRAGHMPDQRRRGDDLVAHDQRGLLLHVDDFQVDLAAEFFLAEAAGVLDGVDGAR